MNYFLTGTDTNVGKTLMSCALLHAFADAGLRVVGMKPIAAGCDQFGLNEDVECLRAASNVDADCALINPYRFAAAIAPHLAAEQANTSICVDKIVQSYAELAALADTVIVEGVGGFCVPLNDTEDTAMLAQQLGLPVILVVGMRLGCLNHALLTRQAIAAAGLPCAGWIANVIEPNMTHLDDNIAALQARLNAPLLGVVGYQTTPDARAVASRLEINLLRQVQ
jgi:dethiobiotin synthetase